MASISGNTGLAFSQPFTCPPGVAVLGVVYHDGSDHVDRADATSEATSPAVGVVVFMASPTSCLLVYKGEMDGFVGLVPTATYYLDIVAGKITTTPPSAVGNVLQRIGWARNTTTLVVEIDLDFQLL